MFPALELGVALAILAQLSAGQSMLSSTLYRRITIEASTWSDIRAHTLTGSKWPITCFSLHFLKKHFSHRSARIQCAAICTANPDCVGYYYELAECHEGNGIGLMGALENSPVTKTVYIDSSQQPGNLQKFTN